jgi:hypothetical protein
MEDRPRLETTLAIHEPSVVFHCVKPTHDDPQHPSPAFLWATLAATRIAAPHATITVPLPVFRTALDDVLDGFRNTSPNPLAVARIAASDVQTAPEDVAVYLLSLAQNVAVGPRTARETRIYTKAA